MITGERANNNEPSDWVKANRHVYKPGFVTTDGQPACQICGNVESFEWHALKCDFCGEFGAHECTRDKVFRFADAY